MEFKRSFRTNTTDTQCVYPKVHSWSLDGSGDCCSWDGVECDEVTGRVIALDLSSSCLSGTMSPNTTLFRLVHVKSLNLAFNSFNFSSIPYGFSNLSKLQYLNLSSSKFSGEIPRDISQLSKLVSLDLSTSSYETLHMPNMGDFVHNLTGLKELDLSLLSELWLSSNNLSGDSLEWVVNLTKLTTLSISGNRLSCGFPSSFENLKDLKFLYLRSLNLKGVLDINNLFSLKNLEVLDLSFNNISFTKTFVNATTLKHLYLDSCNLTEFPQFIGYLSKLAMLILSHNRIRGIIPRWMWNNSKESLEYIDLSDNLLSGFENNQTNLPLPNLSYLDISSNSLETTLPVPPSLVMVYNISNNFLYGEVPTSICEARSLTVLDLSNNALNGTLPPCLGSIRPLILLNLTRNKFDGMIPHVYPNGCALRMIDLRENQLSGIVPRSLGNCGMLEYLNLGDNQINDTFPFWLSKLAYLKVIGLRSNNFHGPIESHLSQLNFTNLHILDISSNNFNGKFPSNLLKSCHAMKVTVGQDKLVYLNVNKDFQGTNVTFSISKTYAMKLMNKGMEREYTKILDVLMAIDLSNNKFEGFIPELIGNLKLLRMLNLSNNLLIGSIPPSLANLTVLESLDLSRNNLVGEIPQQLARLTFLSDFVVSHNHLSGPIPRGTQFDTFASSSFVMNDGLCGSPLPNKCTNGENAPPPPSYFKVDDEEECLFDLDWRMVLVGAGVGFLVGIVLENLIIDEKGTWFLDYSKKMDLNEQGEGKSPSPSSFYPCGVRGKDPDEEPKEEESDEEIPDEELEEEYVEENPEDDPEYDPDED
ncbi:receptor like protein 22 [Eucalyptus grandis]|uniref:receptor like protein 22 n=1 Tax=Eucalyptus grandis TaxID=71139 RepID=UPI00192EF91B|nr:receptor like protein 22 [Eucalyptus grandis]